MIKRLVVSFVLICSTEAAAQERLPSATSKEQCLPDEAEIICMYRLSGLGPVKSRTKGLTQGHQDMRRYDDVVGEPYCGTCSKHCLPALRVRG